MNDTNLITLVTFLPLATGVALLAQGTLARALGSEGLSASAWRGLGLLSTLVTFLIYAGYLHARVLRGWQGRGAAILLLLGFVAVLFTFFGNHFLGGLHAYGGF